MKKILLIALFISVGFSQQLAKVVETYENGNIKSITSHKETRNRIEKVKYVEYYENGQKELVKTYKDGKLIKRKDWDIDGNMIKLLTSLDEETSSINSTPESVMMTLFSAARTGKVEVLKSLLPPEGEGTTDGDCKAICNPGNESMRNELGHNYITLEEFKNYFSKAKIVGNAIINGDQAKVNFVFVSPNGERDETMHLQRIKGKWYLASF
jgi:hypothetical protein